MIADGSTMVGTLTQGPAGQLKFRDGSLASPPAVYTNEPTTAAVPYRLSAGRLDWSVLGADVLSIRAALVHTYVAAQAGLSLTVLSSFGANGAFRRSGDISPAALPAGDTNNYAGASGYAVARMTPDAGGTSALTGIVPQLADGDELVLINIGTVNLTLRHENASSTAANRIKSNTGANLVLAADGIAYLWYDPVTTRWRAWKIF